MDEESTNEDSDDGSDGDGDDGKNDQVEDATRDNVGPIALPKTTGDDGAFEATPVKPTQNSVGEWHQETYIYISYTLYNYIKH